MSKYLLRKGIYNGADNSSASSQIVLEEITLGSAQQEESNSIGLQA